MRNSQLSDGIAIQHGDCIELMAQLPDASVDFILCDLPYGTVNWKSPHEWDNIISFASMWEQYWRILRDKSAICLFGNEPFSTLLKMSQLAQFKYDYIWQKSRAGGFANAKVKPLKQYELISVFSKGTTSPGRANNMPYYPQGLVRVDKTVRNSGKSRLGMTVRENAKTEYVQEYTGYPNDILEYANETGLHPTQKPVPLLEHLIKTYTVEGGVVLDNCMGSGSTGVACLNTNRKFVGMEKDDRYFDIAKMRLLNILASE